MSDPQAPPSAQDKTRIRRLKLKVKHLTEELDQASDLSKGYEAQFQGVLSKFQVDLGLKKPGDEEKKASKKEAPTQPVSQQQAPGSDPRDAPGRQPDPEALKNDNEEIRHAVENHSANAPPWMKKLYKQIAMKTHPDKISHLDISPYEKAEYQRLFDTAKQAVQDSNGADLVYAAEVLDIEPDISSTLRISLLASRGENLKAQIHKIYKAPSWLWCESHNQPDIRKKILLGFCRVYSIKIPEPEFLDKFLTELKE